MANQIRKPTAAAIYIFSAGLYGTTALVRAFQIGLADLDWLPGVTFGSIAGAMFLMFIAGHPLWGFRTPTWLVLVPVACYTGIGVSLLIFDTKLDAGNALLVGIPCTLTAIVLAAARIARTV